MQQPALRVGCLNGIMNKQQRKARKEKKRAQKNREQAARRDRIQRQAEIERRRREAGLIEMEVVGQLPVDSDGNFEIPREAA